MHPQSTIPLKMTAKQMNIRMRQRQYNDEPSPWPNMQGQDLPKLAQ
jgi:hypothetical protein